MATVGAMGALLYLFFVIKIQDIQCKEIMLSAQESSEGVVFFVHNGTEKVSLYVLTHRKLSQEKGSNMVIDYEYNELDLEFFISCCI